jgi:hypothetical protein
VTCRRSIDLPAKNRSGHNVKKDLGWSIALAIGEDKAIMFKDRPGSEV